MGVVYAGYDETLQRDVAVKLLHPRVQTLREAQALARISHPNVVPIYDTGLLEGSVYLAMELVTGETLGDWVDGQSWQQVLATYVAAGRGLAAVHDAGLVHGDFKPANVMRSNDERVLVMDFGLARADVATPPVERAAQPTTELAIPTSAPTLRSETGRMAGTPGYMALELLRGEGADAASDQFAFCVSVWEALYGERPFLGSNPRELAVAQRSEQLRAPPSGSDVPAWVHRAIARGLRPNRADRWASMHALVVALEWDPTRRRRKRLAVGGTAVAILSVTTVLVVERVRTRHCSGAADQLDGVWSPERRALARAAMLGTDLPYASATWARTEAAVRKYVEAWTAQHVDACEATTLRREQPPEVMDLRMACLQRAKVHLDALVELVTRADAQIVENAHKLVEGLQPLSRCADVEALQADVEPPRPDERSAVEEIREHLAIASAARHAGRYTQAQAEVVRARAALDGVTYGPVRVEVALADALVLETTGRYSDAEEAYRTSLELAAEHRLPSVVQTATMRLGWVVGYHQRRFAAGLRYAELASEMAGRDTVAEATAQGILGGILHAQGRYEDAEAMHRRALAGRRRAYGADDPRVGISRTNIALALWSRGELQEAEAMNRTALVALQRALGADHPVVAISSSNLASILDAQGNYVEAEAIHRRALAARQRALGSEHPDVAASHNNLAVALEGQGRYAEAEAVHRRALAIWEQALGSDHPQVATSRNNLAIVLKIQGRYEEAEGTYRQALAVLDEVLGPDHPDAADTRDNLAAVLQQQGEYEQAEALHRRALASLERALDPEHPLIARSRGHLASALWAQGQHEEAERIYREALAASESALGPEHPEVTLLRRSLAGLLHADGRSEAAEAMYRRVLADRQRGQGTDHTNVARSRTDLAGVLLERGGHDDEARALAEQAWRRHQRDDVPADWQATTAFVLARALWATRGEDPARSERARGLGEHALRIATASEGIAAENAERVRAWLKRLP